MAQSKRTTGSFLPFRSCLRALIAVFLLASGCGEEASRPPAAPTSLLAAEVSVSQVNLSWTDNSDDETGFAVERKEAGGTYSEIGTAGADQTGYQDPGLSPSTNYFYRVRAANPSGYSPYSNEAEADTTPPETTITSSPPNLSNSSDAIFAFSSSRSGSTFSCQLDGSSYSPCSSPQVYTGLSEGSHTFEVRSAGTAGLEEETPASHTWTIDTVSPRTTITSAPPETTGSAGAEFEFTGNEDPCSFQCRADATGWSACTSPHSYLSFPEGSHIFQVRATDASGNVEENPATYAWTIDLTPPKTTITSFPPDPSNSPDAAFSFTASSTFQCRLDAGNWINCSSPEIYPGLSEGSHVFQVRATDACGNEEEVPASYTWTIDLTPPNTVITSGPPDPSTSGSATFTFASLDPDATFSCQIDRRGYLPCTSPQTYSGLTDGSHRFEVQARDAAGNVDPIPAYYTWSLDAPPQTTITVAPGVLTNSTTASFIFISDQAGSTFNCQLDGGGYTPCSSPKNYPGPLSEGIHTFEVLATDSTGNPDPTPAGHSWEIDITLPEQSAWEPATGSVVVVTNPFITFLLDEEGDCRWSLSDQAYGDMAGDCTGDGTLSISCSTNGLDDGPRTVYTACRDRAGNEDTAGSNTHLDYTVEAPPVQSGWIPAKGSLLNENSFFIDFDLNENGDCRWSLSDQAYADMAGDCGGDYSTAISCSVSGLSEGPEIVYTACQDQYGNQDTADTNEHINYTIDTISPDTTITSNPPNPSNSAGASFQFTCNESGCSFECQLDSGGFSTCSSPRAYSGLSEGNHTFQVRAWDPAGNLDPTPASYTWEVDIPPDTFINSSPADPLDRQNASFQFSCSQPPCTFDCWLDSGSWDPCTSPRSYTYLSPVEHTFEVRAWDDGGLVDPTPAGYTWDIVLNDWTDYTTSDGLANNGVNALVIDSGGGKWFATLAGVSYLDDNGTPNNNGDDDWTTFSTSDGLANNTISSLAVESGVGIWFGTPNGVSYLDDNGTPGNKSDDDWTTFTTSDGLANNWINALAVDPGGGMWFATIAGVSYLDDNGTPGNKGDDDWTTFTTSDGLVSNTISSLAVESGVGIWFGTPNNGVSYLDDNGTPGNKGDDAWTTFTISNGLVSNTIHTVAVHSGGGKWFGTPAGLSHLDDNGTPGNKGDDAWTIFTTSDGLVSDTVNKVAFDPGQGKWLGTANGVSYLDDNNTPASKGDDVWVSYGSEDGLLSNPATSFAPVTSIGLEDDGGKWFGTPYGVSHLR